MLLRALLVAALGLAPAGCERGGRDAAVLARVNGAEISLAGAAGATGAALREALEKVIDRELLVQRALEERLDRDPQVIAALEAARREVLARAWIERLAAGAAGAVTRERVQAFYADNPALFAERRIYRLRELVVSAPPELLDTLRAEAARAASLDELAAWLRLRGARFSFVSLAQPAEELPLAWLPRLARMASGELAVFARPAYAGAPAGISVVRLEQAEDAPLDEARAAPLIERFLAGRRRLEVAAAELRRLRRAARIEYVTDKR